MQGSYKRAFPIYWKKSISLLLLLSLPAFAGGPFGGKWTDTLNFEHEVAKTTLRTGKNGNVILLQQPETLEKKGEKTAILKKFDIEDLHKELEEKAKEVKKSDKDFNS